jgi:chemotaxis protein histidine kinase CheA
MRKKAKKEEEVKENMEAVEVIAARYGTYGGFDSLDENTISISNPRDMQKMRQATVEEAIKAYHELPFDKKMISCKQMMEIVLAAESSYNLVREERVEELESKLVKLGMECERLFGVIDLLKTENEKLKNAVADREAIEKMKAQEIEDEERAKKNTEEYYVEMRKRQEEGRAVDEPVARIPCPDCSNNSEYYAGVEFEEHVFIKHGWDNERLKKYYKERAARDVRIYGAV